MSKGIDNLRGKFTSAYKQSTNLFVTNIKEILIEDLIPADNIRKKINDESIKELAESIATHGLLQPIIVSPTSSGKYTIIAGQRRYLACKFLGKPTILSHIINNAESTNKTIQLVENLSREDLSLYDKAVAIYEILSEKIQKSGHEEILSKLFSYINKTAGSDNKITVILDTEEKAIAELCDEINLSPSSIVKLFYIFMFPAGVIDLIKKYDIPLRLLETLYKYRNEPFVEEVLKIAIQDKMSVNEIEKLIQRRYIAKSPKTSSLSTRIRLAGKIKALIKDIDEVLSIENLLIKDKDKVKEQLVILKSKLDEIEKKL